MDENQYRCALYHHGIKGMHWGIRRSKDELGYGSNGTDKVAEAEKSVTMKDGYYRSNKGFVAHPDKIHKYCLDPKAKHGKEFQDDGYTSEDAERLFRDLEAGFDLSKKRDAHAGYKGVTVYNIPMQLGVTRKRTYSTVWREDGPDGEPRFTTAYVDRRLKEE